MSRSILVVSGPRIQKPNQPQNRSPPVLPKTTKSEKPVGFRYNIQFSKFGKRKLNRAVFPVYWLGFGRFFITHSNFEWKKANQLGFPVYCLDFFVFVFFKKISKFEFFELELTGFRWTKETVLGWFCQFSSIFESMVRI
jgi:hypothetical protein